MGNSFVKGALIITIATMLSKIIGSVYRIPLQNIAGDGVLAIFTIVYPVYMSVLIVTVAGIPLAISKLISEARVAGRDEDIRDIFVTASILASIFGFVSFAVMFVLAEHIAFLLGGSYAVYSIMVVSITLIFAPYMAVYRGFFQGFDNMKPTAISQVLEQLVRVILILVAAYILTVKGMENETVAAGVMVGSIVGVLASLMYLRWTFVKSGLKAKTKTKLAFSTFRRWAKTILKVSIPICIGALTMALLNMVDSVTVPLQLNALGYHGEEMTGLYGLYGRGLALVQIAVVFASALILPLIPRITAELAKGNTAATKGIVEKAMKFTHLTSWPAAIGLFALTVPVNLALFTDVQGNDVIAILLLSSLFTSFSVLTTGILQGMNKLHTAAIIVVTCSVVKVVLNLILVGQFGLIGASISTLITYILLTVANIWVIHRTLSFQVFERSTFIIAGVSIIMGIVVYAPSIFLHIEAWTRIMALSYVVMMTGIGGAIYAALIVVGRGLSVEELKALPIIGKRMKTRG